MLRRLMAIGGMVMMTAVPGLAQGPPIDSSGLGRAVQQLQGHVGRWAVETTFLNPDGSPARRVDGSYRFEWALPDRVLVGVSEIPELGTASGLLFYLAPARGVIEMVSVGVDGRLWTMTGPLGGEVRETPPFATQGGGESRLRFTRFNITPDSFESRMEHSEDGGKSWVPGNRRVFRRISGPADASRSGRG